MKNRQKKIPQKTKGQIRYSDIKDICIWNSTANRFDKQKFNKLNRCLTNKKI